MSDKRTPEKWEIERVFNELVDEWKPAVGEAGLEQADMVIKTLKPITKICDDCGQVATNRVTHLTANKSPYPHWKELCKACNKWRNPDTNEFTLESHEVQNYYRLKTHLNKNKR